MTMTLRSGSAPGLAPPAPIMPRECGWTGPADRSTAEAAVRVLYDNAGLTPPAILWAPSPIALARAWKLRREAIGNSLRSHIFDGPARRQLSPSWRKHAGQSTARPALSDLSSLLAHEGQKARVGAFARLKILGHALGSITRRSTWQSFRSVSVSPYDHPWLAEPDTGSGGDGKHAAVADALAALVCNSGWIVPCERLCLLSDRPVILAVDDRGRLHGARGPAIAYCDGWSRFAWKGIEVPAAFVLYPERITLNAIDSQTDIFVRRCLIEMVTPKRFIHMGGAELVMHDETGTLWRRSWPRGDGWAAVEVVNGTPGPDGQLERYVLQVPPELETARAAVAWTYGMTDQQYRSLVLRT